MPFKSESQRRFLFARHPEIAKRWSHEYPNQKDLPEKVAKVKEHYKKLGKRRVA